MPSILKILIVRIYVFKIQLHISEHSAIKSRDLRNFVDPPPRHTLRSIYEHGQCLHWTKLLSVLDL